MNLTPEQIEKLSRQIDDLVVVKKKIEIQRQSLNDAKKAIAEDYGMKPVEVGRLFMTRYKDSFKEDFKKIEDFQDLYLSLFPEEKP